VGNLWVEVNGEGEILCRERFAALCFVLRTHVSAATYACWQALLIVGRCLYLFCWHCTGDGRLCVAPRCSLCSDIFARCRRDGSRRSPKIRSAGSCLSTSGIAYLSKNWLTAPIEIAVPWALDIHSNVLPPCCWLGDIRCVRSCHCLRTSDILLLLIPWDGTLSERPKYQMQLLHGEHSLHL